MKAILRGVDRSAKAGSSFRLLLLICAAIGIWNCNLSTQAPDNLLSIQVDDSLSAYDILRVDILHPNGRTFKDSVFYGKYVPDADHKIKDLNLGGNPPTNFQILITGIRDGKRALVVSIQVTPAGAEPPRILVRENPKDTAAIPAETLPVMVVLLTPTPLTVSTNSPATMAMAEVQPKLADQTLLWSSSDTGIVQVDAAGQLHPRAIGEADVTVRSKRDPALSGILRIKVIADIQVKGVTVTPDRLTLYVGGAPFRLTALATPADARVPVIFQSSDEGIAKVTFEGVATAIRIGAADIRVFPEGYPSLSLSCKVTVEIDVPVLKIGGDRNARPDELLAFPITVSQKHGGIAALKWDLDGNGIWDDSADVTAATPKRAYDGKDSVVLARFYARDTEGNVAIDSLKVRIGPSSAAKGPVVTIVSPADGYLTNAAAVGVTWTVKPPIGAVVTNRRSENLAGRQGAIRIIREESDSLGNIGGDTLLIFRDTIAPAPPTFTGQSSPPSVNAAYGSLVKWEWTREAPNDTFLVSLNGGVATRQGATTFELPNPLNRTYILNVVALDSAGNASAAATYPISIDRAAPPAPVVSGSSQSGTLSWFWSAAAGSDGAGIFRRKLSTEQDYSSETSSKSYSPAGLAMGAYTLLVQERDAAGNWSEAGSFTVTAVDTGHGP